MMSRGMCLFNSYATGILYLCKMNCFYKGVKDAK